MFVSYLGTEIKGTTRTDGPDRPVKFRVDYFMHQNVE